MKDPQQTYHHCGNLGGHTEEPLHLPGLRFFFTLEQASLPIGLLDLLEALAVIPHVVTGLDTLLLESTPAP